MEFNISNLKELSKISQAIKSEEESKAAANGTNAKASDGEAIPPQEPIAPSEPIAPQEPIKPQASAIDDIDDETLSKILEKKGLKLQKDDGETEEQRAKREQIEKIEMMRFAVEHLGINADELNVDSAIISKTDKELVYEDFANKLKSKNKDLSDEVIRKRFEKEYFLDEFDDEDDKIYGEEKLKARAEKLRSKATMQLENVKNEYNKFKEVRGIYNKASSEADTFLKEYNGVIEFDDDGNKIPIEIPKDYLSQTFSKKFKDAYMFAKTQNPNGDLDKRKLAESIIIPDMIKHIARTVASIQTNKAVEEAMKPFKNPLTTTKSTEVLSAGGADEKVLESVKNMPRLRNG
jgi:hypothetical protein